MGKKDKQKKQKHDRGGKNAYFPAGSRDLRGPPISFFADQENFRKTRVDFSRGQEAFRDAIDVNDLVFGIGPAGTGKTFVAVVAAIEALESGEVKRIIITRPAVEAGEKHGFLPGTAEQKIAPYLEPIYDIIRKLRGDRQLRYWIEDKKIDIELFAFMRGRTFEEAFVICDEFQNTSARQARMVISRLGIGSKMVVTGDAEQCDLPEGMSGLDKALQAATWVNEERDNGAEFPRIQISRLTLDGDNHRHVIVAAMIDGFDAVQRELTSSGPNRNDPAHPKPDRKPKVS
jgi:phosphate starvation-inducible protein PhoH and related proteins